MFSAQKNSILILQTIIILLINMPWLCRACRGCVELDELTFDKVVKRFPFTLAKFDIAFPYGDKHESFSQFAKEIAENNVGDLLIAVIGIKDYGEKDNEALGKRFSVRTTYPDIKLFRNDSLITWTNYPDGHEISIENLKQFVRDTSTLYIGLNGCIREFDEIAEKFASEPKMIFIDQLEARIEKLTTEKEKSTGKIYSLIMRRILDKGIDFVKMENERVTNLLGSKNSEKKQKELNIRLNILKSFRNGNVKEEL